MATEKQLLKLESLINKVAVAKQNVVSHIATMYPSGATVLFNLTSRQSQYSRARVVSSRWDDASNTPVLRIIMASGTMKLLAANKVIKVLGALTPREVVDKATLIPKKPAAAETVAKVFDYSAQQKRVATLQRKIAGSEAARKKVKLVKGGR